MERPLYDYVQHGSASLGHATANRMRTLRDRLGGLRTRSARDRVRLHSGAEIDYSYLETPRAAWVVPLTTGGEIVLIHQYRYPVRGWVWEVPAGAIGDEAPVEAARRELAEEIGGRCREMRPLGRFYSSSAHLTLEAHVFLAVGVELARADREATELLDVVTLPADEAFARTRSGAINEGQSALALLMAEPVVRGLRD